MSNSDKLKPAASQTNLTRKQTVGITGLHARLKNPKLTTSIDPSQMPNRIALMLDCSGSMGGASIQALRDACTSFVQNCSFGDTALAIETFGDDRRGCLPLTTLQPMLLMTVMGLDAVGGTPMAQAMDFVLNSYSITRGVIVSDGQPDSEQACYETATLYKSAEIPVDCVHIGHSTQGEACLRRIAEITGGQYIKFTDVSSFSKSFKYLTPAFYAQLTSGSVTADDLGAEELK